jgi:putative membrane protein
MKQLVLICLVLASMAPSVGYAATPRTLDAQWLQTSIANDRFEIMAGKLAVRRSSNGHLSALAGRIISDHTRSLTVATALAGRERVDVPSVLTPMMQWHLHILQSLPTSRFEREYITFQIRVHQENIVLAGSEVEFGKDKAVRKLADQESNTLSKHLRLARQALLASG